eukprot:CAMPEP_0198110344 /NCGR_PEP_ID=MMETSP1442-20131203/2353_1 /TAXON_ID= /ORGANISM="Craspedostauros australis, Strain CCMP3328" /LENGTH=32 /DNA_ID= /DNA_START= /DNA_END= /DNA_ORIENTATION=
MPRMPSSPKATSTTCPSTHVTPPEEECQSHTS